MKSRFAVPLVAKDNGHVNFLLIKNSNLYFLNKKKEYFDRDDASGVGDYEDYDDLVKENPTWNCPNPLYVSARTVGTKVNALASG